MTPQESKIKLEIKKAILGALLEKAAVPSELNNLKSVSSVATALILIRKLLSHDNSSPLAYSKANVAHTLTKLKSGTKVFKILSDLLKSIHLSSIPSFHILSPLLVPLVDSMTYCNLQRKKPESEVILEMEQEQQDSPEDPEVLQQDSEEEGDMYFFGLGPLDEDSEDPEGEVADNQDADSEAGEGEMNLNDNDDIEQAYAQADENDTESENVSLDDLIEELKYEDDGESDSEQDDDNQEQVEENSIHSNSNSEEGSDSEGEGNEEDLNVLYGNEPFELEIENEDEMGELFNQNMEENELTDELEMEFLDANQEMMQHLRNIRRPRHQIESNDEEEDELIEIDDDGVGGYRRIMHMVNRFGGRDGNRRNQFLGRDGNQFGIPDLFERHGRDNRRDSDRRHGNDLDSFFQVINQNQNDNEISYWIPPVDENEEIENGRYRLSDIGRFDRPIEDRLRHDGFAMEFQRIRAQIDELQEYGGRLGNINQNRRRNEEAKQARESPSIANPFNIARNLKQNKTSISELLENSCDTKVIENKPSKSEIEQFEKSKKEKEESLLKQKAEMEKQKEQLLKNKEELEKQMKEHRAAEEPQIEGMQSMNLRRQSEENVQQESVQNPPNEEGNIGEVSQDVPMQPSNTEDQTENTAHNRENTSVNHDNQQPPIQEENKEEENKEPQNPGNSTSQNTGARNENEQPSSQEVPDNVDPRIAAMIRSFDLTFDQVRNESIDIEVLGFLPEEEVASILSSIQVVSQDVAQSSAEVDQQQQLAENPPSAVREEQPSEEEKQNSLRESENANNEQEQAQDQELQNEEARSSQQIEQSPLPSQNESQEIIPPTQANQPDTPASQPLPQMQENLSNDQLLLDFMSGLQRRQSDLPLNPGSGIPGMQNSNIENNITRVLEQTLRNAGGPPANMFPPMGGMNFTMPSMPQIPPMPSQQNIGRSPAPSAPSQPVHIPSNAPAQESSPMREGAPVIRNENEENKGEQAENDNQASQLPEGIDMELFNSLPEEYKQELLADANLMRRNLGQPPAEPEPPQRESDPMDTASFLASLTDQNLRREILITMDEQTMQTLPEHIQVEGRRYQRELQRRHHRRQANPERMFRRMMNRVDRDQNHPRHRDQRQDDYNFVEILCRMEEKLIQSNPEASDISTSTIRHVFTDDKNLRSLIRIIMIASQQKDYIDFKTLAAPIDN